MGPNDADIIRVYTKEAAGTVADTTLDSSKDANVVVEVEAGSAVFSAAAKYQTGLVVKDLVDGTLIPFSPPPVSGALSTAPWTTQDAEFVYTITAADLGPHKGHLCQVYAYLLIGVTDFDASFVESPMFLILP